MVSKEKFKTDFSKKLFHLKRLKEIKFGQRHKVNYKGEEEILDPIEIDEILDKEVKI